MKTLQNYKSNLAFRNTVEDHDNKIAGPMLWPSECQKPDKNQKKSNSTNEPGLLLLAPLSIIANSQAFRPNAQHRTALISRQAFHFSSLCPAARDSPIPLSAGWRCSLRLAFAYQHFFYWIYDVFLDNSRKTRPFCILLCGFSPRSFELLVIIPQPAWRE